MVPPPDGDEFDDLGDVLDLEPERDGSRRPRRRPDRRSRAGRPSTVRPWKSSDDEAPWDDVLDDEDGKTPREKPPVFWRARDSLYFEPLVALAIIVVLLVSLFAYTSNWPPVYVVESNSMQHGPGDHLGYINAGDIVLAQKAGLGSIVTYVDALSTGFSTYGLLGDVLLYYPNGSTGATPIVHRAIIYLQYDAHNQTYNATGLPANACGAGSSDLYATPGTAGGCATNYLTLSDTLQLFRVGGRTVTVDFSCTSVLGGHSGFVTLGDNNSNPDQNTQTCAPSLSTLVEPGWVIGVARGLIPWFGALKLLLDGNAGKVPTASWEYLGLTIAGVIFAAAGLHVLLRRRREERPHRRRRRAEDDEEPPDEEAAPSRPRRILTAVQPMKRPPNPPDEEEAPPSRTTGRASHEQRRRSHFTSSREHRPDRRRSSETGGSDDPDGPDSAS